MRIRKEFDGLCVETIYFSHSQGAGRACRELVAVDDGGDVGGAERVEVARRSGGRSVRDGRGEGSVPAAAWRNPGEAPKGR